MVEKYQRKADDQTILALNSVGLSLGSIARRLNVHPTTITYRLKVLGVEPADTRRSFMEDLYDSLSPAQQTWLISQLGPGQSVKGFLRSLLIKAYITRTTIRPGG